MFGFDVRIARVVWTGLLVVFLLFAAYSLHSTLLVVVFAVFFSYLLYPLVEVIERFKPKRLPRTVSIGIVFIFAVLVFGAAGALFGTTITEEAVRLSQQLPTLLDPANISARVPLPDFLEPQRARILLFVTEQVQAGTGQALPMAQRLGLGVMEAATNLIYLILIPVLSFLLIKEAPLLRAEFLSSLGTVSAPLWRGILEDLDVLLSKYVRALLLLSMATFTVYSLFIGPLSAVVIILCVAAFSGFSHLIWLLIFIIAYRMFQDYVLNPMLMSEGVEVSPLLIIVGLLAGDELAGVTGIFLSVPVLAAIKVLFVRMRSSPDLIDRTIHASN
jgi:predicted PurR-regulated permease PerM